MYIGDEFANGRCGIIHKLGFGRSSTVWLARDRQCTQGSGKLVTLKALRADASNADSPDLVIPKTIEDHFVVDGRNGSHDFLVSAFSGPSIQAMLYRPDRPRLRAALARKIAAQAACAMEHIHRAGFVHGDFTTSNLLFRLKDKVMKWSDNKVYTHFGSPITDEVRTCSGQLVGPHAPSELVEAIGHDTFANILEENIIVIDFGQSYRAPDPPKDYEPATLADYMSPETRFEKRVGPEADVTGGALFDPFFPSDTYIIPQMIATLGRLPDPWYNAFRNRAQCFEEDGQPEEGSSIREKLRSFGTPKRIPGYNRGPMFEKMETKMDDKEVELLTDLLEKMLRYRPENRIGIREVVDHPWFKE
ncbi:kinase-like domain-containing protein [Lentinula edodes]|uniref:non-specific serine/threonine protein kinase n=1 Tax=Lentinula lateritia TaxID=40482 RepID=A0A9W9DSI2_9AGAR|nr:kinase-like domain-containing protein [Lentinula edodes]